MLQKAHSKTVCCLLDVLDLHRLTRGLQPTCRELDTVRVTHLKRELRHLAIEGFPRKRIGHVDHESGYTYLACISESKRWPGR